MPNNKAIFPSSSTLCFCIFFFTRFVLSDRKKYAANRRPMSIEQMRLVDGSQCASLAIRIENIIPCCWCTVKDIPNSWCGKLHKISAHREIWTTRSKKRAFSDRKAEEDTKFALERLCYGIVVLCFDRKRRRRFSLLSRPHIVDPIGIIYGRFHLVRRNQCVSIGGNCTSCYYTRLSSRNYG